MKNKALHLIKKRRDKKLTTTFFLTLCFFQLIHSQTFDLSADLRPRFEYRHGFNSLFPDNADPAAFVTQRSRLNLNYQDERLKLMLSVQDVSTWGDTPQTSPIDGNDSFSLFQAWQSLV